jgi:hypothetical protein
LHRQIQNLTSIKIYGGNQAFHISGYITKIILAKDLLSQKWKPQNQSYINRKHKKSCYTNSGFGEMQIVYSYPSSLLTPFMPLVVCFQERSRDKRGGSNEKMVGKNLKNNGNDKCLKCHSFI